MRPMRAVLLLVLWLLGPLPAWAQGGGDVRGAAGVLARGASTEARAAAAKALGASRDPAALEPLLKALEDANREVRWAAVEALGELGDRRAMAALLEYLKRPEPYRWGKRLAANALGAIGDPAAAEPLAGLLGDEDPFVRRLAALALIRIGEPRTLRQVGELAAGSADETLPTVKRELARAAETAGRRRAGPPAGPAGRLAPPAPREWAGLRVGASRMAEARERFGAPLQDAPEFMLFAGDRFPGPVRADSVVVNADPRGLVESIFVFPVWGTLDRDVRALLGPGKLMPYAEFLRSTGRTQHGAGTRAGGKLHYVPPDVATESYPEMGILVVYDSADMAAADRLVKLLIVY